MTEMEYAIKVIEDYIFHRKNVVVKIIFRVEDIGRITLGYNIALQWFRSNGTILPAEVAQE